MSLLYDTQKNLKSVGRITDNDKLNLSEKGEIILFSNKPIL